MGLVDYFSRQPNQEAKVKNKYDEKFAVATTTLIRDAIAAIYVNTTHQNCQSHNFCSVNHRHSTIYSHPHPTNYSNLFSAINLTTTQLLLENSANAAQIHFNSISNSLSSQIQPLFKFNGNSAQIHLISQFNMTSTKSNPQTPYPQQGHVPVDTKLRRELHSLFK